MTLSKVGEDPSPSPSPSVVQITQASEDLAWGNVPDKHHLPQITRVLSAWHLVLQTTGTSDKGIVCVWGGGG